MLSDKKLNKISNVIVKHFAQIGRLNISIQNGVFIITGDNAKELHDVLVTMPYYIQGVRHIELSNQYSIILNQESAEQLVRVIKKELKESYLRELCQDFNNKDPKLPIIKIQDYDTKYGFKEYAVMLPKPRHRVLGEFQEYLNQRFDSYCDWTNRPRHEQKIDGTNYTGISITKYDIACMQKIDFDRQAVVNTELMSEINRLKLALEEAQARNTEADAMMQVLGKNLKINMPENTAKFRHLDFDSVKRLRDGLSNGNSKEVISCFGRN